MKKGLAIPGVFHGPSFTKCKDDPIQVKGEQLVTPQ